MDDREKRFHFSVGSSAIYGITVVLALLVPALVHPGSYGLEIYSVAWSATYLYEYQRWHFGLTGNWTSVIPLALIRCLFVFQEKRYYEYKSDLRPTILFGWIVDCFVPLFYIITSFLGAFTGTIVSTTGELALPAPLMVVVAWFLMGKHPRRDDKQSWVEKDSTGARGPEAVAGEGNDK